MLFDQNVLTLFLCRVYSHFNFVVVMVILVTFTQSAECFLFSVFMFALPMSAFHLVILSSMV